MKFFAGKVNKAGAGVWKVPEIREKALAIFGKLEYNRCRKEGKEIKKHESTEH